MTARRARVVDLGPDLLGLEEVGLFVSYDDREDAKSLGSYRWDSDRKCWRFPASMRWECQRVANRLNEANGYPVSDADREAAEAPFGRRRTRQNGHQRPPAGLSEAIVALFELLPPSTRRGALRGLQRALHPDTGGDHAAMQALNAATERLKL